MQHLLPHTPVSKDPVLLAMLTVHYRPSPPPPARLCASRVATTRYLSCGETNKHRGLAPEWC